MNNLTNSFKQNGYFNYPILDLGKSINNLSKHWHWFYEQPHFEKSRHPFQDYIGGYEFKGEGSLDYKENFHYSLKYQIPLTGSSINVAFLKSNEQVIRECYDWAKRIVTQMDRASGSNMASLLDIERFTLRCLHYFPTFGTQRENDLLAASHIDKGITIHLYEDCSGLEILWNGQWVKVLHDPKKALGYFGMLGQLYSNCTFPALCHRVAPTPYSSRHGRSPIVLFIDFGDQVYDKETWGLTQQVFPNGENYNMPIEEFSKYFKKVA